MVPGHDETHNTDCIHLGKRCHEKTPLEMLVTGKKLWYEKEFGVVDNDGVNVFDVPEEMAAVNSCLIQDKKAFFPKFNDSNQSSTSRIFLSTSSMENGFAIKPEAPASIRDLYDACSLYPLISNTFARTS